MTEKVKKVIDILFKNQFEDIPIRPYHSDRLSSFYNRGAIWDIYKGDGLEIYYCKDILDPYSLKEVSYIEVLGLDSKEINDLYLFVTEGMSNYPKVELEVGI